MNVYALFVFSVLCDKCDVDCTPLHAHTLSLAQVEARAVLEGQVIPPARLVDCMLCSCHLVCMDGVFVCVGTVSIGVLMCCCVLQYRIKDVVDAHALDGHGVVAEGCDCHGRRYGACAVYLCATCTAPSIVWTRAYCMRPSLVSCLTAICVDFYVNLCVNLCVDLCVNFCAKQAVLSCGGSKCV